MIKVLITDDVAAQRKRLVAGLVRGADPVNSIHRAVIKKLFDIREYHVVGKAIEQLEGGEFAPDLALLDISFHELKEHEINDEHSNYDIALERGELRGFDLYDKVRNICPYCRIILFTAHAGNPDYYTKLQQQGITQNNAFLPLLGKEVAVPQLQEHTQQELRAIAEDLLLGLDQAALQAEIQQGGANAQTPLTVKSNGITEVYLAGHLLAYMASFSGDDLIYNGLEARLHGLAAPRRGGFEDEIVLR